MKEYPKISVVTPVYNQAKYLEQTILSVVNQEYPNLEYIIIDGGSTDGTADIIRKYANQFEIGDLKLENFIWISEPDKGMYDAIQKGFERSTGEIMCWLNSDDVFFDKCLFAIADVFMHHPEVEWFSGKSASIDTKGMITGVDDIEQIRFTKYDFYLNRAFWIPQSSTVWRRSIWEKIGGSLDTNLRLAGDFDLWLRFINVAPQYVVNTLIGTYRVREGQLSQMMDKYMAEVEVSVKNHPLPAGKLPLLRQYARKLKWAERIDKLKIFNGERVVRLRDFVGKHHLKPDVIKCHKGQKHF